MSRYVDIDLIERELNENGFYELEKIPTVDAVPVVRGNWEEKEVVNLKIDDWQTARCSVCGKWHTTPYLYYFNNYNFCPHCGAKMDEVTE